MNIDRRRHVEPTASTLQVLRARLVERFGPERAAEIWERAIGVYEEFVAEMPYTGGWRNVHAHSLYDSVFIFAWWEALPEDAKETTEEFGRTVSLVFNGTEGPSVESSSDGKSSFFVGRLIQTVGTHAPWLVRLGGPVLRMAFAVENHNVRTGRWNNAWVTKVNESLPEGCLLHVELIGCPLVDFAREHGYMDLMPAMCNSDFDMLEPLGLHLIRPTTVAMGYPSCNQYFCLEKSPMAEASPVLTDKEGYLYNGLPPVSVEPKIPLRWRSYNVIAPLLRRAIRKRYGYDLATECYSTARPIYAKLIDEAPRIGAGNPMASNIYTCFVPFAFYLAAEGRLTPDMLRACIVDLVDDLHVDAIARLRAFGHPGVVRRLNKRLRANASWAEERPAIADATWDFHFDDGPAVGLDGKRVHYHFTHCPLNDFAREHGLLDVLPVMCEVDYVTARLLGARLTRNNVLAQDGPCCDYLFEARE